MKKYQLINVTSPSIEFECMGEVIESTVIENTKKTPNFAQPVLEKRILVSLAIMDVENYSLGYLTQFVYLFLCLYICLSVWFSLCLSNLYILLPMTGQIPTSSACIHVHVVND